MNTLLAKLIETLKTDDRLVVEGKLAKNKVIELALQLDADLLKLLRSSKDLSKTFFQQVDDFLVFDKVKFQSFVSNKQFLPDSFTEYKNKIGLISDKEYLTDSEEVVLAFPYKDCVLEGGQTKEDAKRSEVFWNETLAPSEIDKLLEPKVITNFKKYDVKGEQPVRDITSEDNLILKGNNLLSLYSLKKRYREKIKLIYIDPPYNTSGDSNTFAYNNTFNHSTWLTFMKNRLKVSRELLADDGVIAIAIDDEEQAYLKVLCDEVFRRENYIGTLVVQIKPSGRTTDTYLATSHEYVLFYSKNPGVPEINFFELTEEQKSQYKEGDGDQAFKWRDFLRTGGFSTPEERPNSFYPIYFNPKTKEITLESKGKDCVEIFPIDSTGKKRVWRKTPASFIKHVKNDEINILENSKGEWKVQIIDRIKKGFRPKSVWVGSKYDASSHGTKLLKEIFDGEKVFSFPKSIYAVKDVIDLFTEEGGDDIVLDFFGGSGTTAHAVLMLNEEDKGKRRFILCEQMDYIETVTAERIRKTLKNHKTSSFVFAELTKANQLFVDKIQDSKNTKELFKVWDEMKKTAFLSYKVKPEEIDATKKDFETLSLEDQQKFLISILDKNLLYIPYSEIEDKTYKVSKEEIVLNNKFYGRN
jgi:adenine-specific DNA-methyltransferase